MRTPSRLVMSLLLLSSCATTFGPYYVDRNNPYGAQRPYGRHPGIDFEASVGTPVIAPSPGQVTEIRRFDGPQPWQGGFVVRISHVAQFESVYIHLTALHVERAQSVKRGELIGLSGAPNMGWAHLHFGICRKAGCIDYSDTYNPEEFWLGGKPQCFSPSIDYSSYSQREITLPLACGEYAKELVARIKNK